MKWLDNFFEKKTRTLAEQASRRSALVKVGKLFVGAAFVLPVLPFDRIGQSAQAFEKGKGHASSDDDTSCDYWRYCALDGYLCTCCGGTISSRGSAITGFSRARNGKSRSTRRSATTSSR